VVTLVLTYIGGAFLLFYMQDHVALPEPQRKYVSVAAFVALAMIHAFYGKRFVRLSEVSSPDGLSFPLEDRREPDIDLSVEERAEEELSEWSEQQRVKGERGMRPWRCAKCREENPGTFEVCWRCHAEK
jgi:hypothetical protein